MCMRVVARDGCAAWHCLIRSASRPCARCWWRAESFPAAPHRPALCDRHPYHLDFRNTCFQGSKPGPQQPFPCSLSQKCAFCVSQVYKGLWKGTVVAVKCVMLPANMSGQEKREKMAVMEAAVSGSFGDQCDCQAFSCCLLGCTGRCWAATRVDLCTLHARARPFTRVVAHEQARLGTISYG